MNITKIGALVKASSVYVMNWIIKQDCVKEESLTDWFLYDTSTKIPCFYYKEFSRKEESRVTGADWEWWMIFNSGAIRFRIQAKKVVSSSNYFMAFTYTPANQNIRQIDRLIANAKATNSYPVYVFYTNDGTGTACRRHIVDEGVYVSSAFTIYRDFVNQPPTTVAKIDVLNRSIPISCLFLCPVAIASPVHNSIYSVLYHYFSADFAETKDLPPGAYAAVPDYILQFINFSKENNFALWEDENGDNIKGIDHLVVLDLRDVALE